MVKVLWLVNFRKELRQLKEQIAIAKEDLALINAMLAPPRKSFPSQPSRKPKHGRNAAGPKS